jgi:ribosomal protein S12 methylthiotransferase
VIVTGCLGAEPDYITGAHPKVLAVTGPQQYEQVLDAVHAAVPPSPDPFVDLLPAQGIKLTPRHYSYLKISEGCNHTCKFCIIPSMRGRLQSARPMRCCGRRKSWSRPGCASFWSSRQDTSAYGTDWKERERRSSPSSTSPAIWEPRRLGAAALRLPLSACARAGPADGGGADPALPRHPVPARAPRHAAPHGPARRRRAHARRDRGVAAVCPEITLRSTFIVGYPGETEAEFQTLLDWLDEAQLDRVGCFQYENVAGARSNALPDHVPEAVKEERWDRFMERRRRFPRRNSRPRSAARSR